MSGRDIDMNGENQGTRLKKMPPRYITSNSPLISPPLCYTCVNRFEYPLCKPAGGNNDNEIYVIQYCENYENVVKEKVLVSEKPEIVVNGTKEKPYFEIKYKKVGSDDYNVGYGSYDLNNCFQWLEEEFEVVSEAVGILTEAEKLAQAISFETKMDICRCCDKYNICAILHSSKCSFLIKKIEDTLRTLREESGKEGR